MLKSFENRAELICNSFLKAYRLMFEYFSIAFEADGRFLGSSLQTSVSLASYPIESCIIIIIEYSII